MKRNSFAVVLVSVCLFAFSSAVLTREARALDSEEQEIRLEEVVVTASRLPTTVFRSADSVSVISVDEATGGISHDAVSVLEDVEGVRVMRHGGMESIASIFLRGMRNAHTLVMLDGTKLNSPTLGGADLSWMPLTGLDRIEVVRGPASAVHGADAVGGVVNFITSVPEEDEFSMMVAAGSFDTYILNMSTAVSHYQDSFIASVGLRQSHGCRDNDDFKGLGTMLRYGHELAPDQHLSVLGVWSSRQRGVPGPMPEEGTSPQLGNEDVSSLYDYNNEDVGIFGVSLKTPMLSVSADVRDSRQFNHGEYIGFLPPNRHKVDSEFNTLVYGLDVSCTVAGDTLVIGTEVDCAEADRTSEDRDVVLGTTVKSDWEKNTFYTGVYAETRGEISDWTLSGGVRYDRPADFDGQTTYNAGVVWSPTEDMDLRLKTGTSYRAPSLNDLFWPTDAWSEGNPDLVPESGASVEFGARYSSDWGLSLDACVFYHDVDDMIAWQLDPDWMFRPHNLNQVFTTGFEAGASYQVGPSTFGLAFTTMNAKERHSQYGTRRLSHVPFSKFDFSWSLKDLASWNFRVACQYVADAVNYYPLVVGYDTKKADEYFLVGVRIEKEWRNLSVYVSAENVFDEEYIVQFGNSMNDRDYPMPGRYIEGGVKARF